MEIASNYVGSPTKPHPAEVTARHSMNFAAAVGDDNPVYFNDEDPDALIAPPMIATALTWPISLNIGEYLLAEDFPAHLNQHQVHYTESIRWSRPMRPGDTYVIEGSLQALLRHPAGTHMVMQYDAIDPAGDTAFTEYSGALLRGVNVLDESLGKDNFPAIPRYKVQNGPVWEEKIAISPLACHVYDGCADISFPIHTSPAFAKSVGLPEIILHGTATLSIAVRELINREAGRDPSRLRALDCIFSGMVLPGTAITVKFLGREEQADEESLYFEVLNHEGKKAVSRGRLGLAT